MINKAKSFARVFTAFFGFFYDWKRFLFYADWRQSIERLDERNYVAVRVYHGLEKSLSLSSRNKSAGVANANLLSAVVRAAIKSGQYGYHDRVAINVLRGFLDQVEGMENAPELKTEFDLVKNFETVGGGRIQLDLEFMRGGLLADPNKFFNSRYSVREFSDQYIASEEILKAVSLAMKTPSVCNRQAWHVYDIENADVISGVLSLQNGNRGFGHKIKRLLVVATDLRGFVTGRERYQHWIDGGMFAMSLIWAMHSLGIASCCLNWSQDAKTDILLRSKFEISSHHTVIMCIAIGYPLDVNSVCASLRRPISEVYTKI